MRALQVAVAAELHAVVTEEGLLSNFRYRPLQRKICLAAGIFEGSKAKPRKFTETVELQVRISDGYCLILAEFAFTA